MRVRYVALVPVEFEEDVFGGDDFITQWGREKMSQEYPSVESAHWRRGHPYDPMLVEVVKLDEEDGQIDLRDLVAPGITA